MDEEAELLRWIVEATHAEGATKGERIQSLWSGYGEIFRVRLSGLSHVANETAIVKWVKPPARPGGRRITTTGSSAGDAVSHARKCRSYEVETAWYKTFASRCDEACRVPALIASRAAGGDQQWLLLLEDLDAAGYPRRRRDLDGDEIDACLAWLAAFHARFLGVTPTGLWKTGTYWHLATRRDELAAIDDDALRDAAPILDRKLSGATYQTILHGDAKPANFCFAASKKRSASTVAALDFQYVGGGCGMKDVAYLLSGTPSSHQASEPRHLDTYFRHLREGIARRASETTTSLTDVVDVDALENEWRALYPIACADFYRFLAGWAKDHWRRDTVGQRFTREVLRSL